MRIADLTDRLTEIARIDLAIARPVVEYRGGVLWLRRESSVIDYDGSRQIISVGPIGLPREGLRRLTQTISRMADEMEVES